MQRTSWNVSVRVSLSLGQDKASESSCKRRERDLSVNLEQGGFLCAFSICSPAAGLLWILSLCQVWPPLIQHSENTFASDQLTTPTLHFVWWKWRQYLNQLLSVKLAWRLKAPMCYLMIGRSRIQSYSCWHIRCQPVASLLCKRVLKNKAKYSWEKQETKRDFYFPVVIVKALSDNKRVVCFEEKTRTADEEELLSSASCQFLDYTVVD